MTDTQTIEPHLLFETKNPGSEVAILGAVTAVTVFGTKGGVDAILERITAQARAVETDISTQAGRAGVASLAYKIARSKTALLGMGKDLGEANYRAWKAITSERARIETALDALAADIRRPLTDFENADKARTAAHAAAIDALIESPEFYHATNSAEDLRRRLEHLETYPARDWQEFTKRAAFAIECEIYSTKRALAAAEKREADAEAAAKAAREEAEAAAAREAEHQRQRVAAAATNARQEAEERARVAAEAEARRAAAEKQAAVEKVERENREAAAKAKAEAEALATRIELDRQAEALARRQAEQKARADAAARARIDAEHLAAVERQKQEASDRADRAEASRIAATAKARADLERGAQEAEAKRKADVEQAAAAERQKIADKQAKEAAETAAREANQRHRAKINNEALADLVASTGIADATARAVLTAIVSGKVRHTRVSY